MRSLRSKGPHPDRPPTQVTDPRLRHATLTEIETQLARRMHQHAARVHASDKLTKSDYPAREDNWFALPAHITTILARLIR
jgi:hypothetical protein